MDVSKPEVQNHSGPSLVWLIPLLTLLVGAWLVVKTVSEQGPQVTISFKTAEGIEVGKTRVKYKNVDIGVVDTVRFSDDFSNVIVTVDFNHGTENFLRRNTRFWVVKPQLSIRGASGLGTLVSGAYIEIEPGPGASQTHFTGLDSRPVISADEIGRRVVLVSQNLGSIDTGSPVYFQGLLAGEVLGKELGNDRKSIYIHAFIRDPFDQLLRGNTRFWNVSGIDVSVGADGFRLRTESIQSLMFGGIAFETPQTMESTVTNIDDLVFTLHQNYDSIEEQTYTRKLRFVLFFDGSVRGLSIGAPVEFKGIKVGSVLDIRLEFDNVTTGFRIPVIIEIEPERILEKNTGLIDTSYSTLEKLVSRGLRARLQTGSLLTSQLFVELDMHPGTPVLLSGTEDNTYPELPTLEAANLDAITASMQGLLQKLNALNIEEIAAVLIETLKGAGKTINSANELINDPGISGMIEDMRASLAAFKNIMQEVDGSNLEQVIAAGQTALDSLNATLSSTNHLLKPDSPLQYNAIKMTSELEETARAIRTLIETLERDPQSLIFGRDKQAK